MICCDSFNHLFFKFNDSHFCSFWFSIFKVCDYDVFRFVNFWGTLRLLWYIFLLCLLPPVWGTVISMGSLYSVKVGYWRCVLIADCPMLAPPHWKMSKNSQRKNKQEDKFALAVRYSVYLLFMYSLFWVGTVTVPTI